MTFYTGLWLKEERGNNAFSYCLRKEYLQSDPQIWIPERKEGNIRDVCIGGEIAFEEVNTSGEIRSCKGLQNFVQFFYTNRGKKIPIVIFDNHNHAFFFWHEALHREYIQKKSHLVHIDAHTDMRKPSKLLSIEDAKDMQKVFEYTNYELNVGNFIVPALHTECIESNITMITTEHALYTLTPKNLQLKQDQTIIVDIDLDFWEEELMSISVEESIPRVQEWLGVADFVTVATSPFFMEQGRALEVFQEIFMGTYSL